jgi:hypothetical protein
LVSHSLFVFGEEEEEKGSEAPMVVRGDEGKVREKETMTWPRSGLYERLE